MRKFYILGEGSSAVHVLAGQGPQLEKRHTVYGGTARENREAAEAIRRWLQLGEVARVSRQKVSPVVALVRRVVALVRR